ncbi:MAG: thioredoxin fold domain-containing protein [Candidatus Delongbacteria bacterium]|nr:thioredoxin fold domain-containing protein [Candidatus Delongbacteria bacterium]
MKNMMRILTALFLMSISAIAFPANEFDPETDIKITHFVDKADLNDGDQFKVLLSLEVPNDFHITDSDLFYVDTESAPDYKLTHKVVTEKVKHHDVPVYKGKVDILLDGTFKVTESENIVNFGYQICSELGDESCYMPVDKELKIDFSLIAPDIFKGIEQIDHKEETGEIIEQNNPEVGVFGALFGGDDEMSIEERLAGILEGSQTWTLLVFLIAFLGGILDSMTPCVYPIIPVVISYMGAKSGSKKSSGFFLSLFFVVGLAITYSIVGLLASFLGGIFGVGDLAANPIVRAGIAVVFVVLALSMFGLWDMNIISSEQQTKFMKKGKESKGILGAVIIGMVSGVVAAPCVGPVLAVLLMHVAAAGDMLYGWLLFVTFAFGLGILFLIIGTFSGAINALPQAGAWMVNIKKFFGVVMIGAALFFVHIMLPNHIVSLLIAILTLLLATFMGAFNKFEPHSGFFKLLGKAISIFLLVVSIVFTLKTLAHYTDLPFGGNMISQEQQIGEVHIPFNKSNSDMMIVEDAIKSIKGTDKLVMVDLWAEWCGNCLELDKVTWNYPEVVEFSEENFIPVKLDFTKKNSEFSKKYINQYKEYGATNIPLILFIDENGEVVKKIQGLVEGERMLKKMKSIVKENK